MDEIQFADGFDAPERLAFGLGAGQLVTVVAGGLSAYLLLHTPLPTPVAMPTAATVAVVAAALGWLRVAGRPALDWAIYACRYAVRPGSGVFLVEPAGDEAHAAAPHRPAPNRPAPNLAPVADRDDPLLRPPAAPAPNIIPLRTHHHVALHGRGRLAVRDRSPLAISPEGLPSSRREGMHGGRAGLRIGGAHRITFFSLKGGTGRTTLAVELACALAAGAHGHGERGTQLATALLDLDVRSASVGVRLGIAHAGLMEFALALPDERSIRDFMAPHSSGAEVLVGPPGLTNPEWPVTAPLLREILRELDVEGFDVVVMDVSPELSAVTRAALNSSDDVFVVVVPTASGVHDAYRTTEQLRHVGLRHQLRYVVNRARGDVDVGVTIADLAGQLVAEIPDDSALAEAENSHQVMSLHADSEGARALQRFSRRIRSELTFACAT